MQSQGGKESWPAKLGIVKKSRPSIASATKKDEYCRYDPDIERFSMVHRITPYRRDVAVFPTAIPAHVVSGVEEWPPRFHAVPEFCPS